MTELRVVTEPAAISALMRRQEAAGFGFRNPLYRGALAGEYCIAEMLPGGRLAAPLLWRDAPPTVIVVGDDNAGRSRGPEDFPQAGRVLAWAARLVLYAAGGKVEHYRATAEAARACGRVALVETSTTNEPAWMAAIGAEQGRRAGAALAPLNVLHITARPGAVDPLRGTPA
jgi:hypothetical protein